MKLDRGRICVVRKPGRKRQSIKEDAGRSRPGTRVVTKGGVDNKKFAKMVKGDQRSMAKGVTEKL